ncbi:MAG TPA: YccF domain-containing protein [Lachnospiraceae bacterium]|nr:YccF domain-containing protein [Lachnospiraceae bacterium]HPF28941.1 YccF domain-containing protein [Lachnospiraceae bacterium]
MRFLGNILWVVLGGLMAALMWLIVGVIWGITGIGIPIGLQCFKFASLSLWPFGLQYFKFAKLGLMPLGARVVNI